MIAIIDYDMGNIHSVKNALSYLGEEPVITNDPKVILSADGIILPGVGSFNEGMNNLHNLGLVGPLTRAVNENKTPFMGICIGMQLLATKGSEGGQTNGLNFIPGEVTEIKASHQLKIPHVGFNRVSFKNPSYIINSLNENNDFYFVHSYSFKVQNENDILGTSVYGENIVSAVQKDNILGFQFHPEKSQSNGLILFKNFIEKVSQSAEKKIDFHSIV